MRKSKQQRIDEGNELIEAIKQDPVLAQEQSWLIGFLSDLVAKFKRGKGGTSRQRALFDEKIAAGVPARKVNTHVAQPEVKRAEASLAILQQQPTLYSYEIRVGGELIASGLRHNLSDKQIALLNGFSDKADMLEKQLSSAGQMDESDLQEAKLICDIADTYIGLTARKTKDVNILRSAIANGIGFTPEQLEAGRVAVSGEMKKYKKYTQRWETGMMVRFVVSYNNKIEACLVVGPPVIGDFGNNGRGWQGVATKSIRIPIIANGQLLHVWPNKIEKYTKKELKALGAL
jgi:hypothetical protein